MGGYAFNVWAVYAVFLVFIFVNLVFPIVRRKKILREIKKQSVFEHTDTDSMD
jgi:heme exporter protein CcmD